MVEEKTESRLGSLQNTARQEFENQPSQNQFNLYVIKPDKVEEVWEAKEPN